MQFLRLRVCAHRLLVAVGVALAGTAVAGVVISGTRVVYPAGARDVNVRLNNTGEQPALVQVWLDNGNPDVAPENIDVPFRVTPTLFRMEPSRNQSLRLVYAPEGANGALPSDRESLFWLNVLDMPPRSSASRDENYLQFSVRSRIKLFYRPKGLPGSAATAPEALLWQVSKDGQALKLTATNPTPFHVSMGDIQLLSAEKEVGPSASGMVGPKASEVFVVEGVDPAVAIPTRVKYKAVNDYGGIIEGEATVSPLKSK